MSADDGKDKVAKDEPVIKEDNTCLCPVIKQETSTVEETAENSFNKKCPICHENIRNPIGSPDCCDHIYCSRCIKKWAKNMNRCPLDRLKFDFIFIRKSLSSPHITRKIPVRDCDLVVDNITFTLAEAANMFHDTQDDDHCQVCGQSSDPHILLLCDSCSLGYHTYCLVPSLNAVPSGEWFCPVCQPGLNFSQEHEFSSISPLPSQARRISSARRTNRLPSNRRRSAAASRRRRFTRRSALSRARSLSARLARRQQIQEIRDEVVREYGTPEPLPELSSNDERMEHVDFENESIPYSLPSTSAARRPGVTRRYGRKLSKKAKRRSATRRRRTYRSGCRTLASRNSSTSSYLNPAAAAAATSRARILSRLGIVAVQPSRQMPTTKLPQQLPLTSRRAVVSVGSMMPPSELSIFGNDYQLPSISDEGEEVDVATSSEVVPSFTPPPTSSSDLLSGLMECQAFLHLPASQLRIASDGRIKPGSKGGVKIPYRGPSVPSPQKQSQYGKTKPSITTCTVGTSEPESSKAANVPSSKGNTQGDEMYDPFHPTSEDSSSPHESVLQNTNGPGGSENGIQPEAKFIVKSGGTKDAEKSAKTEPEYNSSNDDSAKKRKRSRDRSPPYRSNSKTTKDRAGSRKSPESSRPRRRESRSPESSRQRRRESRSPEASKNRKENKTEKREKSDKIDKPTKKPASSERPEKSHRRSRSRSRSVSRKRVRSPESARRPRRSRSRSRSNRDRERDRERERERERNRIRERDRDRDREREKERSRRRTPTPPRKPRAEGRSRDRERSSDKRRTSKDQDVKEDTSILQSPSSRRDPFTLLTSEAEAKVNMMRQQLQNEQNVPPQPSTASGQSNSVTQLQQLQQMLQQQQQQHQPGGSQASAFAFGEQSLAQQLLAAQGNQPHQAPIPIQPQDIFTSHPPPPIFNAMIPPPPSQFPPAFNRQSNGQSNEPSNPPQPWMPQQAVQVRPDVPPPPPTSSQSGQAINSLSKSSVPAPQPSQPVNQPAVSNPTPQSILQSLAALGAIINKKQAPPPPPPGSASKSKTNAPAKSNSNAPPPPPPPPKSQPYEPENFDENSMMSASNSSEDVPASAVDLQNKRAKRAGQLLLSQIEDCVKKIVKPHYASGKLDKDGYKEVMKKCVTKIFAKKPRHLNENKVKDFVEAYLTRAMAESKRRQRHHQPRGHQDNEDSAASSSVDAPTSSSNNQSSSHLVPAPKSASSLSLPPLPPLS